MNKPKRIYFKKLKVGAIRNEFKCTLTFKSEK